MWRSKLEPRAVYTRAYAYTVSLSAFPFSFLYICAFVRAPWQRESACVCPARVTTTHGTRVNCTCITRACNCLCVLNVSVCDLCVLFWLRNRCDTPGSRYRLHLPQSPSSKSRCRGSASNSVRRIRRRRLNYVTRSARRQAKTRSRSLRPQTTRASSFGFRRNLFFAFGRASPPPSARAWP